MTDNKILQPIELIRVNGGQKGIRERIIRETALTLYLNGDIYATAMIMAGMERKFAIGHLYAQGIISRITDITSLSVTEKAVEITLAEGFKSSPKREPVNSDLVIHRDHVFTCVKAILKSKIFSETEAVHSAGLFLEGEEPVAITEDLGRHHALDKCIGAALLAGIDFSRTLAASTGRQPTEMIHKCRNAGIPIMATKGVPTSLAVALAKESGITIAGLVRGERYDCLFSPGADPMSREPISIKMPCRKLDNGRFMDADPAVIIESELHIIVNGERLATASLLPGMEKEFVTGYLFGQGFIKKQADIASITVENRAAQVTLSNPMVPSPTTASYRIVSGGGRTAFAGGHLSPIASDLTLEKKVVFKAMNRLFDMGTVYKETEGAHAAGIFTPHGEAVCIIEDIGRHNCLDKAIGYALLRNIPLCDHFLVSTGRMSSEMMAKLCRAGFPVVATKTAVTDKGREIALVCGMTLIGFVRDTGIKIHTDMSVRIIKEPVMKVYTGAHRITQRGRPLYLYI